jgi:hypothetical protein
MFTLLVELIAHARQVRVAQARQHSRAQRIRGTPI